MRATTSFSVNASDVDHSELVARHDTTLVQTESVLELSLLLVDEALLNVDAISDKTVSLILDLELLPSRQRLVVSDVQVSLLGRLLSAGLPDVGTKNSAARREDNVSTRVVGQQLNAPFHVYFTLDLLADKVHVLGHLDADLVQNALSNLDDINNVNVAKAFNVHLASIILLAARRGVESGLIQNDQVSELRLSVGVNCDDLTRKLRQVAVSIVQVVSLGQVNRVVQNLLGGLAHTLLSSCNLVIKVTGNWQL